MRGKGELILTGQLGEVMKESAQAARELPALARRRPRDRPRRRSRRSDIHVHIPEGAIPKDGPSAGVAMAAAIASALTARPVRHRLAMTGEITLRGNVLPVGGIKEKVLAARRAKVEAVLLPRLNRKEVDEPCRRDCSAISAWSSSRRSVRRSIASSPSPLLGRAVPGHGGRPGAWPGEGGPLAGRSGGSGRAAGPTRRPAAGLRIPLRPGVAGRAFARVSQEGPKPAATARDAAEEREIIRAAQAGDGQAFEELVLPAPEPGVLARPSGGGQRRGRQGRHPERARPPVARAAQVRRALRLLDLALSHDRQPRHRQPAPVVAPRPRHAARRFPGRGRAGRRRAARAGRRTAPPSRARCRASSTSCACCCRRSSARSSRCARSTVSPPRRWPRSSASAPRPCATTCSRRGARSRRR